MDSIRSDFQKLVQGKENSITNIGVATNKKFVDILKKSRTSEDPISIKGFLCPLYDNSWSIRSDFTSFDDVPLRARRKLESYKLIFDVLKKYMWLDPTFLLADRWVALVNPNYNIKNFSSDIERMRLLFLSAIRSQIDQNAKIKTFSEIGVPIDQITNDSEPTTEMIYNLFEQFWIDFRKFQNQYAILAQSFGAWWAFSICRDYLIESRFTSETDSNSIYMNVESCSPMNTLYQIGIPGKRLIDQNLYIWASYRV